MKTYRILKEYIKYLENSWTSYILFIDGIRYEMDYCGSLKTPIPDDILKKEIVYYKRFKCDPSSGYEYKIIILLKPEGNEEEVLEKEFFYTQYNKLCKKIQKNFTREGEELIGISCNLEFDDNGLPYLEVKSIIGDYGTIYNSRYYV